MFTKWNIRASSIICSLTPLVLFKYLDKLCLNLFNIIFLLYIYNRKILNNSNILEKHNIALAKISKLDGSVKYCPFVNIFSVLIIIIENKSNNEIENINTNYDIILNVYANISLSKKNVDKIQEVTGMLKAIEYGTESIKSDGFINKNTFTKIQQIIRNNNTQ